MKTQRNIVVNYPGDITRRLIVDSELKPYQLLEKVFAWFNGGSGEECEMFKSSRMRSLSVNDFVRVDSQWYQCKGCGWSEVTEQYVDEIEKKVVDHPDYDKHGGFWCLDQIMWDEARD